MCVDTEEKLLEKDPQSDSSPTKKQAKEKRLPNYILSYNWDNDINAALRPIPLVTDDLNSNFAPLGIQPLISRITVEADPDDILVITTQRNNTQTTVLAHANLWKQTLDRYICTYFQLKSKQAEMEPRNNWQRISFPENVTNKILTHKKKYQKSLKTDIEQKEKVKKKTRRLAINESCLQIPIKNGSRIEGAGFETPSIGMPLYLNYYLRNLYLSPNAKVEKINSLPHNGLIFQIPQNNNNQEQKERYIEIDESNNILYNIPQFALEDYFLHELFSSISLTIEISAVLVEMTSKYNNTDLWKKAFLDFKSRVLPTILTSNLFFTRNCVARAFFQQIFLELSIHAYQWNSNALFSWESEECWKKIIAHAVSHVNTIRTNSRANIYTIDKKIMELNINYTEPEYDLSEFELNQSLSHLNSLIAQVSSPLNISKYIQKPTHGLALFCNPHHKNIDYYLDILSSGIRKYPTYDKAPFEIKTFYDVRSAIAQVNDFLHHYNGIKEPTNTHIFFKSNIPRKFWRIFRELHESGGGLIFLERFTDQYFMGIQDGKSTVNNIVKRILSLKDQKLNTIKESLAKDNIQIWYFNDKEIISIVVP